MGIDQKYKVSSTGGRKENPPQGFGLTCRVKSLIIQKNLGVKLLLIQIEKNQLRWFGHRTRMPSGQIQLDLYQALALNRDLGADSGPTGETILYLTVGLGISEDHLVGARILIDFGLDRNLATESITTRDSKYISSDLVS